MSGCMGTMGCAPLHKGRQSRPLKSVKCNRLHASPDPYLHHTGDSGSTMQLICWFIYHHIYGEIKAASFSPLLHLQSWSPATCGYLRCCGVPHQTWCGRAGCCQITDSCRQQRWVNALPQTLEMPLQILAIRAQAFIFPWQIRWSSVPFTACLFLLFSSYETFKTEVLSALCD